jgi:hypothetical protein
MSFHSRAAAERCLPMRDPPRTGRSLDTQPTQWKQGGLEPPEFTVTADLTRPRACLHSIAAVRPLPKKHYPVIEPLAGQGISIQARSVTLGVTESATTTGRIATLRASAAPGTGSGTIDRRARHRSECHRRAGAAGPAYAPRSAQPQANLASARPHHPSGRALRCEHGRRASAHRRSPAAHYALNVALSVLVCLCPLVGV